MPRRLHWVMGGASGTERFWDWSDTGELASYQEVNEELFRVREENVVLKGMIAALREPPPTAKAAGSAGSVPAAPASASSSGETSGAPDSSAAGWAYVSVRSALKKRKS